MYVHSGKLVKRQILIYVYANQLVFVSHFLCGCQDAAPSRFIVFMQDKHNELGL